MRFLLPDESGRVAFDPYFRYIESIRGRLSQAAYAFASNYDHYSMQSKKSLHDAWIRSINIEEIGSGSRMEVRQLAIRVSMLGPYHDCILNLAYEGVTSYSMNVTCKSVGSFAHGDIVMHEISVTDADLIAHEIMFETGSMLLVQCSDLSFQIASL